MALKVAHRSTDDETETNVVDLLASPRPCNPLARLSEFFCTGFCSDVRSEFEPTCNRSLSRRYRRKHVHIKQSESSIISEPSRYLNRSFLSIGDFQPTQRAPEIADAACSGVTSTPSKSCDSGGGLKANSERIHSRLADEMLLNDMVRLLELCVVLLVLFFSTCYAVVSLHSSILFELHSKYLYETYFSNERSR